MKVKHVNENSFREIVVERVFSSPILKGHYDLKTNVLKITHIIDSQILYAEEDSYSI